MLRRLNAPNRSDWRGRKPWRPSSVEQERLRQETAAFPAPPAWSGAPQIRGSLVGAVLALAIFSDGVRYAFSSAITPLEREFHLSPASVGAGFAAFAWSYMLLQPFAGWAVVRFGRRRMAALGLLLSAGGSIWTAMAADAASLMLSRVLVGAGLSIVLPIRCAIFALLPEARRAVMNGLFECCTSLSVFVLPSLATSIAVSTGWRSSIAGTAMAAVILAVMWLWIDRPAGAGASVDGSRHGLRNRTALGCYAAYFAYTWCLQVGAFWGPQLMRRAGMAIGSSVAISGWLYGILGASALLSGWLSDQRIGTTTGQAQRTRTRFVVIGLLLAVLIGGTGLSGNVMLVYVLTIVAGSGLGLVIANLWALLQSAAPPGEAAKWGGIQGFSGGLAGLILQAVGGSVAVNEAGPAVMPLLAAAICLAAAFGARTLFRVKDPPSSKAGAAATAAT